MDLMKHSMYVRKIER